MSTFLDDIINPDFAPQHFSQDSEEWEQIRAGRFTSSEIWKILECGKRPMTKAELDARPKKGKGSATTQVPDPGKMSAKGIAYINQKVAEVLTGRPKPSAYAYPLVYGKETEPEAVMYFENLTGLECTEIGFQPWSDHAGGSPDRFIGELAGLEVKCPFQSENQIDYLMLTDYHDLKRNHPDYYWQCVSLMLFTGRNIWHFGAFDPRMKEPKHKFKHLILDANESETLKEDMDLIPVALEAAVKMKLEILKSLE